jgi:hypothetical protein
VEGAGGGRGATGSGKLQAAPGSLILTGSMKHFSMNSSTRTVQTPVQTRFLSLLYTIIQYIAMIHIQSGTSRNGTRVKRHKT